MPTVDIIMPAYNAGRYISAAIRSVLDQTFQDWQLVIVDDGSTDNTAAIVDSFREELGPRLTFVQQPNAGLPAARNTAIRHSSSELLALLDSDDIWLPNRLAESVASLQKNPAAGLSYGLITRIDADGKLGETFRGNPKFASGRIARAIYLREVDLPCPTMTFRRSALEPTGLFDETMRATEDRDLWFRIAQHHEVAFIPEVIALYRTSPQSMSVDLDRMLSSQLKFIHKHSGARECGFAARQIAISRAYKQRAEALALRNEHGPALMSALQALAIWPFRASNLRTAASLLLNFLGLNRDRR
jgi:glycosyltransferase involved in cell wall biosynthesis